MKKIGKEFLNATNGGIDIFQKYIKTPFNMDEWTEAESGLYRFKVIDNESYGNHSIHIDMKYDGKWSRIENLNAVWYIKWSFDLSEQEVYEKLDEEMDLGILSKSQKRSRKLLNL